MPYGFVRTQPARNCNVQQSLLCALPFGVFYRATMIMTMTFFSVSCFLMSASRIHDCACFGLSITFLRQVLRFTMPMYDNYICLLMIVTYGRVHVQHRCSSSYSAYNHLIMAWDRVGFIQSTLFYTLQSRRLSRFIMSWVSM